MNRSQSFLFWGILTIAGIYVLFWLREKRCERRYPRGLQEGYSPYRNTGGCSPKTGWKYLDVYTMNDLYKNYPYVYPAPTNYVRELLKKKDSYDRYLSERIQKYIDSK